MTWVRPRYFKVIEEHGMKQEELHKKQAPFVEVSVIQELKPWISQLEKKGVHFCIAKYASVVAGQRRVMRVFGIFLKTEQP